MTKKGRKPSRREKPKLPDTVRLSAAGLAKVLGDLEARVMSAVWRIGTPAPARQVYEEVIREHSVALLTVVTVLNKLAFKGLLERRRKGDLFHYEARLSEQEFLARISRRAVEGILSLAPQAVAASFVDVLAERDPSQLAELERLIRSRLKAQRD